MIGPVLGWWSCGLKAYSCVRWFKELSPGSIWPPQSAFLTGKSYIDNHRVYDIGILCFLTSCVRIFKAIFSSQTWTPWWFRTINFHISGLIPSSFSELVIRIQTEIAQPLPRWLTVFHCQGKFLAIVASCVLPWLNHRCENEPGIRAAIWKLIVPNLIIWHQQITRLKI